ncbi:hypothetical protein FALB51S_00427 [Frigidibacter albus]
MPSELRRFMTRKPRKNETRRLANIHFINLQRRYLCFDQQWTVLRNQIHEVVRGTQHGTFVHLLQPQHNSLGRCAHFKPPNPVQKILTPFCKLSVRLGEVLDIRGSLFSPSDVKRKDLEFHPGNLLPDCRHLGVKPANFAPDLCGLALQCQ